MLEFSEEGSSRVDENRTAPAAIANAEMSHSSAAVLLNRTVNNEVRAAVNRQAQRPSSSDAWIKVTDIYLGIYRFGGPISGSSNSNSESAERPLYIRVDGSNNQCVLLDEGVMSDTPAPMQIEELPFEHIKKIICGPVHEGSSECFIAFTIKPSLRLNSIGVGPNCMLCPTLPHCMIDSAKFILVALDKKELQVFRAQMEKLPYFQQRNGGAGWMLYENRWPTPCVKEYMFAHEHRAMHTIDELRDRAIREQAARLTNGRDSVFRDIMTAASSTAPQAPQVASSSSSSSSEPITRNAAKRKRTELTNAVTVPTASVLAAATVPEAPFAAPQLPPLPQLAHLPPPPPISSRVEFAMWVVKRSLDVNEIKMLLLDNQMRALLSQAEIDQLKSRLVQLVLQ